MATVFRPTIIRYVNSQGKRVPKSTAGAKRIREKSKTWWGRFRDAQGSPKRVSLCDNRGMAETMLAEIANRAKREAAGDIDPYEDHRKRPLSDHLDDFETSLLAKGATTKQASQATARCRKIIEGCGFKRLIDLVPSAVASYLKDRRKTGTSIQTSNHYLAGIKSFSNWLLRDRRIPTNPLVHLSRLNAKVDIRHERRSLSPDELLRIIHATERSATVFRGLNGETRAMLYRLATMTGLRAAELASLTPASFDLKAETPTITVEAGYSKRRRKDILPLRADLVELIRTWLKQRKLKRDVGDDPDILSLTPAAGSERDQLFPGNWPEKAAKMLRVDMDAARTSWIEEAEGNDAETKKRNASTMLKPLDESGCVVDFHALRHTFVSNLASGGVHPKVAQQLARHSTITLTMDRYSHLGLIDMSAGLSALPALVATGPSKLQATGTAGAESDLGCTNGCTHPAEINQFQPLSAVPEPPESGIPKNKKPHDSKQKMLKITGNSVVHPAGLEPATFGSVDRCSIQLS